eukprot:GHVS01051103.1.p1 GENE.GHVS01051103.1~~GHVS01051103.1.p1  ORF type:complete len:1149 (+),score=109.47 GHVS01051103.1:464-3448(+)
MATPKDIALLCNKLTKLVLYPEFFVTAVIQYLPVVVYKSNHIDLPIFAHFLASLSSYPPVAHTTLQEAWTLLCAVTLSQLHQLNFQGIASLLHSYHKISMHDTEFLNSLLERIPQTCQQAHPRQLATVAWVAQCVDRLDAALLHQLHLRAREVLPSFSPRDLAVYYAAIVRTRFFSLHHRTAKDKMEWARESSNGIISLTTSDLTLYIKKSLPRCSPIDLSWLLHSLSFSPFRDTDLLASLTSHIVTSAADLPSDVLCQAALHLPRRSEGILRAVISQLTNERALHELSGQDICNLVSALSTVPSSTSLQIPPDFLSSLLSRFTCILSSDSPSTISSHCLIRSATCFLSLLGHDLPTSFFKQLTAIGTALVPHFSLLDTLEAAKFVADILEHVDKHKKGHSGEESEGGRWQEKELRCWLYLMADNAHKRLLTCGCAADGTRCWAGSQVSGLADSLARARCDPSQFFSDVEQHLEQWQDEHTPADTARLTYALALIKPDGFNFDLLWKMIRHRLALFSAKQLMSLVSAVHISDGCQGPSSLRLRSLAFRLREEVSAGALDDNASLSQLIDVWASAEERDVEFITDVVQRISACLPMWQRASAAAGTEPKECKRAGMITLSDICKIGYGLGQLGYLSSSLHITLKHNADSLLHKLFECLAKTFHNPDIHLNTADGSSAIRLLVALTLWGPADVEKGKMYYLLLLDGLRPHSDGRLRFSHYTQRTKIGRSCLELSVAHMIYCYGLTKQETDVAGSILHGETKHHDDQCIGASDEVLSFFSESHHNNCLELKAMQINQEWLLNHLYACQHRKASCLSTGQSRAARLSEIELDVFQTLVALSETQEDDLTLSPATMLSCHPYTIRVAEMRYGISFEVGCRDDFIPEQDGALLEWNAWQSARHRLLRRRRLKVALIPFFDWEELTDVVQKARYLRKKIFRAVEADRPSTDTICESRHGDAKEQHRQSNTDTTALCASTQVGIPFVRNECFARLGKACSLS